MKTGLLFSGQGAQSVGMAKSLYENCGAVRELFDRADDALSMKLSKYCFEGPSSELTKTSVCQPALFLHGFAAVEAMRQKGILGEPSTALGLSLGELTAHAFAGTFSFETGLKIVAERGRLMQEACDASKGAMASFIGGSPEDVAAYCREFDVDMSNVNCPGQVVISGEEAKVAAAVEAAKERKAFAEYLEGIEFKSPRIPVFTNVTGDAVFDPFEIKKNLVKQVVSTVRWEDCVRNAAKLGIDQFYECGPGGVLAGMVRRIDKSLNVKSISEYSDL